MDLDEKLRLARQGDMSLEACAIRLKAARLATGMMQKDFAAAAGFGKSTLANQEAGTTYPSREVMRYLYRAHRIDFNFILHGDFAQLPADVQAALFEQLPVAEREWDRKESSGPAPAKPPRAQRT
jgi:transcriptional regulator with XRE-family HTH domain